MCPYNRCGQPLHARGYCQRHYQWLRRNGLLDNVRKTVVVGDKAGSDCQICHRRLLDHAVGEFCLIEERYK